MKRRISLLLAMVMILGSFSAVFANEAEKIANPAEFLENEGVLKGDKDGDLLLDEPLDRRDAVILLSRLMGVEKEAKNFEEKGLPTWTDSKDPHYDGYLAWAQSNEYFKGHAGEREDEFGPFDNILAVEYSIVLLRALGYVDVDYYESYDKAAKLGLFENVEKVAAEEITRAEMAQMTVNALFVEVKDTNERLGDYLKLDMPAPEVLEVNEVIADNLKEIKVVFNRDVDEDLLNLDFYETNAGDIENMFIEDNNVLVLVLEEETANKKDRKLTIEGTEEPKLILKELKKEESAS